MIHPVFTSLSLLLLSVFLPGGGQWLQRVDKNRYYTGKCSGYQGTPASGVPPLYWRKKFSDLYKKTTFAPYSLLNTA